MAYYRVNPSKILCTSCGLHLGSFTPNYYGAKFHYCEECDKAQKIHPDCEFLQNWDEDIFQEPFADFTLEGSDGGVVRAHKAVLAGKSKVFKAMLRAGMSESVNGKVKISDMTAGELKPLNDFLYSGKVNQASLECHGVALYRASVKYDLPLLTAICESFLESNAAKDVRGVFELAVDYKVKKFQEAVLPFIFSEGFVERNRPVLVMKTLRAASKFECFAAYREKNLKTIPSLMETAFYRAAEYCESLQKEDEEPNEMVWICCIMKVKMDKLKRFLHDELTTRFIYEMKHGLELASIIDNQTAFGKALKELLKDIHKNKGPFFDKLDFFSQLLKWKKVVWMEGELGWTAWFDDHDDVLK